MNPLNSFKKGEELIKAVIVGIDDKVHQMLLRYRTSSTIRYSVLYPKATKFYGF
jgi:hypothetical protein